MFFKWDLPANLIGVISTLNFPHSTSRERRTQPLTGLTAYPFTPSGQVGFNQQSTAFRQLHVSIRDKPEAGQASTLIPQLGQIQLACTGQKLRRCGQTACRPPIRRMTPGIVVFHGQHGRQTAYCGSYDPNRLGQPPNGPAFAIS